MKAQILIFDNINLHTPENGVQPNTPPVAARKTLDAANGVLDAAASLLAEGASGQYAGIVLRSKSVNSTSGDTEISDTNTHDALLGELEALGAPKKPYVTPSYAITVGEEYSKPQILEIPEYGYFAARIVNGFTVKTFNDPDTALVCDLFMLTSVFPAFRGMQDKTLDLNNQSWCDKKINLNIEAKPVMYRDEETWYEVTGLEIGDSPDPSKYYFTPYTGDFSPPKESVAIEEGCAYEEKVSLLYNAGIITSEKTDHYTTSCINDPGPSYTYYRLTDQALEYAHRKQGS